MKNMKENFKNKKAITLIALVITIVILIILAGVLISITLGNNGIFTKAKTAKEMYMNSQDYEQTEIAKTANEIDGYINNSRNQYEEGYLKGKESVKLVRVDLDEFVWNPNSESTYTYNLTNIEGYENFTTDNFVVSYDCIKVIGGQSNPTGDDTIGPQISSYENGILTLDVPRYVRNIHNGCSVNMDIYVTLFYLEY